ncbi:uncharacterized protein PHACADRAFT_250298 [Phanerochaete carnosa HHB-10118-sp]|uniref:NADP-dependent oxidoreductase domain-containing protein n=1 Tax=Phanerochaete carnosa (strain HHB-10118-sp) TaxID=650164 RepID=K5WJR9_PHACS|nr:uncharacterized protein PHACADRAFT_250298 [Phanerochaete carnosa HHB-10118-sp]EKM59660.1 hypothetical protein PHACADRAFT_250298 [Phanerochaete carnosa HHB-10118-sp]
MSVWAPPALPPTKLGIHRPLASRAGVHVSPIQLGAMSIGDKWQAFGMGSMDKDSSFKLLDAFYDAGGNFVDTANNYQDESSEEFIGEWMEQRGIRDQIVLATKYTTDFRRGKGGQHSAFVGNSVKSMHTSVTASLKKLRTDYIDILYLHWWDYTTSVEEVMDGLHTLIQQGKVLYLGVSDTPAWVVSQANTYARLTGKTPFTIYQGKWSIMDRDFERDILPMCVAQGMAVAPWNVLAGGKIRTDAEERRRLESGEGGRQLFGDWKRTPEERQVCLELEQVATEVGAKSITSVAIAWIMQKAPHVFPIVGGRKVEHLHDNIEALSVHLSDEQIARLDSAVPFDKGFPYTGFGDGTSYNFLHQSAGHFQRWPKAGPIKPELSKQ